MLFCIISDRVFVVLSMESQCSVASSTMDSQVSEDWSTEEEEDAYDDYYGECGMAHVITMGDRPHTTSDESAED